MSLLKELSFASNPHRGRPAQPDSPPRVRTIAAFMLLAPLRALAQTPATAPATEPIAQDAPVVQTAPRRPAALAAPSPPPPPSGARPALPSPPLDPAATAGQKPPEPTHLEIALPNGTSIRFGVLWQGQFEALGNSANDDYSKNIFLRRFALQLAGTVLHHFEYFIDTDFADLMKAAGSESVKNGPNIYTKDALFTLRAIDDALKIEGGLLLPPGARNSLLGGAVLFNLDFFKNTFRHNLVFNSENNPFGRDLGVQLRGLVGGGLLEYRLGTFQGLRAAPAAGPPSRPGSRNSFRVAGRLQLNLLDAETGYLYAGTYLGKKRILSFGVSADYQHETENPYLAYAADGALDVPLGPGGITAEVDVVHRDGGDLVELPEQTYLGAEAGYRIDPIALSPILRFERRWMDAAPGGETDLGAGLAYWAFGHTSNLKVLYQRVIPESPAAAYHQLNLQAQVFFF